MKGYSTYQRRPPVPPREFEPEPPQEWLRVERTIVAFVIIAMVASLALAIGFWIGRAL